MAEGGGASVDVSAREWHRQGLRGDGVHDDDHDDVVVVKDEEEEEKKERKKERERERRT